ncbi:hypothetical protein LTR70_009515 [Exophiala xenobiotica]|uniref:Uncharacterized protein n=1 Tax=Lithohypha guttulata TaxID=1690604 RepID=A0ABR0JX37_9EURO|nr:hypothetical protein LTR24_009425 [Lithohypha guttulata]KAK5310409.1 hypothetical protein LTR70_009515 [Exophiala xenobiotica]
MDHPSDLARTSRLSMDFGGHLNFDHGMDDDIDDAGLFADTADHDFSLPPTHTTVHTTVHPPSTQQAGQHTGPQADTTIPSGFSKGAVRRRELMSRPDATGISQRRVTSPLNRRSAGSGVSKSRPTAPTATAPVSGSLRRSLQETLHRASSIQTLESQIAALHARLQAFEDRMSQIEAESQRTQDELRVCMSEVNGALEIAESFNHQMGERS